MQAIHIAIPDLEAAKQFVNVTEKYKDLFLQIQSDHLIIDPHSIMGVLSLDLSKKMVLHVADDYPEAFMKEISPFIVEST